MIYKYQKVTDEYTTYTLIADEDVIELSTVDGWTYCIAQNVDLSIQPEQIRDSVEAVELSEEENLIVKTASPVVAAKLSKINRDVNAYITAYYDTGTQNSFNGIYSRRSTPDDVRDTLDLIWDWIESVINYYYGKKNDILTSEEFSDIVWDFSQFDETKPNVTLASIMNELAG